MKIMKRISAVKNCMKKAIYKKAGKTITISELAE